MSFHRNFKETQCVGIEKQIADGITPPAESQVQRRFLLSELGSLHQCSMFMKTIDGEKLYPE